MCRLINHTAKCTGPPLLILRDPRFAHGQPIVQPAFYDRSCQNCYCIVIFVLYWAIMLVVAGVGLVTGASIYPLVWNVLLAARAEGLAGVVTTLVVPAEEEVRDLLGLPETHAVAAMVPLGVPVRRLTRLNRRPVEDFTSVDRFDGEPLRPGAG